MIKEIKITNFYSFNESIVELHNCTNILIGVNGAGKSNFLKAVKLLKEGVIKRIGSTKGGHWEITK